MDRESCRVMAPLSPPDFCWEKLKQDMSVAMSSIRQIIYNV